LTGLRNISYKNGKFAENGKSLYVITDKDSEFAHLAARDLATGQHTRLTPDLGWGVEEFAISRDYRQIAFTTNEDGISVLRLLDTRTDALTIPKGIPVGVISGLCWHTNDQDLAFTLLSARSPSDVYSLDFVTDKIDRWTRSETGGLNTDRFSEPELVHWPSFDSRAISGFRYRPAGDDVLRRVGQTLQNCARDTDSVARYGGEEFVVILPHTEVSGACTLAERYQTAISETYWPCRSVTVSIDVAARLSATSDASTLLGQADQALYRSKEGGRNRVTSWADPALSSQSMQAAGEIATV
jgi:hypothetical protein